MSEAFERVIAEQQKVIDQLKLYLDESDASWQKNFKKKEALKDAVFLVLNNPGNAENVVFLRDALRGQGWCLRCEQMLCECDD